MKTMKKVMALLLALMMVLSLAACGNSGKDDNGGNGGKDQPAAVDMTAQEVLDALKEKLGDSYGCDLAEDESRMTGYYQLDMSKIDSWAAESSENSALDPSTAVVLKVKDGYAQDAAALEASTARKCPMLFSTSGPSRPSTSAPPRTSTMHQGCRT